MTLSSKSRPPKGGNLRMSGALLKSVSEIPVVASERQVLVGNDPAGDRMFLSPEQGRDLSRIAMRLLRDTRSVLEYLPRDVVRQPRG